MNAGTPVHIDYTRHLTLAGEITFEGVSALIAEIRKLELESAEPIYVTLCSTGGSTAAALWVCDYIRCMSNKVVIIAGGTIQSAALTIYASADRRYAYPSTTFFAHSTMCHIECNNPQELQALSQEYLLTNRLAGEMEASGTNLSEDEWLTICVKNRAFDVQEAIDLGLVHGVIPWRDRS